MKHPLDVLVLGMHYHSAQGDTIVARRYLRNHDCVRSFGSTESFDEAESLISQGIVNTVFINPWVDYGNKMIPFIAKQRELHREIVFVLYTEPETHKRLSEKSHRLEHYFAVDPAWLHAGDKEGISKADSVLARCQESLFEHYNYDIAISFSGNEREQARDIAEHLRALGDRVFFDEFVEEELLGKDLYAYLHNVYSRDARYCVMLVSKSYSHRAWTNHERRSSQERTLNQAGGEYILPVKVDDTRLPGVFSTIGYVSLQKGAESIAELVHKKLWNIPAPESKRIIGSEGPDSERYF
jgi:hypothetical protein